MDNPPTITPIIPIITLKIHIMQSIGKSVKTLSLFALSDAKFDHRN